MITWIFGQSKSGKSTRARELIAVANLKWKPTIHLDGDEMRGTITSDLGFSAEDRAENNLRIARLAKLLDEQGFDVVVSTICPYRELRDKVYRICGCNWIYMEGGVSHPDYPFEALRAPGDLDDV